MPRRPNAFVLFVLACGCEVPPTQLVVAVWSDLDVPLEMATSPSVRTSTRRNSGLTDSRPDR